MFTAVLILLIIALLFFVVLQISKTSDLIDAIKKENNKESHSKSALYFSLIGFGVLIYTIISWITESKKFLPVSASEEGVAIDNLMNFILVLTGIVFILTHILLFYFVYKYHYRKDRKADFYPHNSKLEIIWTTVPAIVMIGIVLFSLSSWSKIFSKQDEGTLAIEVTGKQFAWVVRYPGKDGKLGVRDFTLVNSDNELGVNWNNKNSHDDMLVDEIVLPVNKPVIVHIGALDVIHSFYLPEFRVMMDAVPGVPTKMAFKPTITTEEMRKKLENPDFNYVLACNQLCGSGHYNMQKRVRVVTEDEYKQWLREQKSYYRTVVKPALDDKAAQDTAVVTTNSGNFENTLTTGFSLVGAITNGVENKLIDFLNSNQAVSKDLWFSFDRLLFATGKSTLLPSSQEQLKNIAEILKAYPNVEIKLGGYTDNIVKPEDNLKLSTDRAKSVLNELSKLGVDVKRLSSEGYGQEHSVASNDTDAGRQQNRRIDIRVTKK